MSLTKIVLASFFIPSFFLSVSAVKAQNTLCSPGSMSKIQCKQSPTSMPDPKPPKLKLCYKQPSVIPPKIPTSLTPSGALAPLPPRSLAPHPSMRVPNLQC